MTARAVRLDVLPPAGAADPDEALSSALDVFSCSWGAGPDGTTSVRLSEEDGSLAREALVAAGFEVLSEQVEEEHDWVAEAAALRRPVAVGRYLLDPHEGEAATPPEGRIRLELPAARAFGTGSHESTRLAIRLLLSTRLEGTRVLDAGCGTGTLAFVAAREGAARCVAFDLDPDAAFATRIQARANGLAAVRTFAGPADAIGGEGRFDVAVANMLQEEVTPLLPALRRLLVPGGWLLTSGQLLARQAEWLGVLAAGGFSPEGLVAEGEWLGVAAMVSKEA